MSEDSDNSQGLAALSAEELEKLLRLRAERNQRTPKCARCRNHGAVSPLKGSLVWYLLTKLIFPILGHKRYCKCEY